jgi:hypothetical protein
MDGGSVLEMDGSREQPLMTAGLDLGDKYSYSSASSIKTAARLWKRASCVPPPKPSGDASERPLRNVIVAGTHSPWASSVLKECGHKLLMASPR